MAAVLLLGVVSMAVLLSSLSSSNAATQQAIKTQLALKEAKEAVLGYILLDSAASNAESETPNLKPGSLPCPDLDNDDDNDFDDNVGASCSSTGNFVYRFPSKNFGAGGLRDASNEKLWYAVSPDFRTTTGKAINSSTPALIRIDNRGEYVAVILAPGLALPGQTRHTTATRNAYLEEQNAGGTVNFTTQRQRAEGESEEQAKTKFNDRLIGISKKEWEDAVTRRVASEIITKLLEVKLATGRFPWAAEWTVSPTRYISAKSSKPQGLLPVSDLWPEPPAPVSNADQKKDWFAENGWYRFAYYAVAPAFWPGASGNCLNEGCLTVNQDGVIHRDVHAVVILTGGALTGQARPGDRLADYIESEANRDGNASFEHSRSNSNSNDRLFMLK